MYYLDEEERGELQPSYCEIDNLNHDPENTNAGCLITFVVIAVIVFTMCAY
jgi:hypothetical protein